MLNIRKITASMLVLVLTILFAGCEMPEEASAPETKSFNVDDIPVYSGNAYTEINSNKPYFTEKEYTTEAFESYSDLDSLGRCGTAYACVGTELMPTESRGSIGSVKPTGWHTVKYDIVDGKYLYNRCHLIGYQLTGENANEKNLITGTRSLNIDGMLPFENMVADYIKETNNHVLYRVTPVFKDDDLLAGGVMMEGYSVEDRGEGICFNVYAYNVQNGIVIDYTNGASKLSDEERDKQERDYVLNTKTKKYHLPECEAAAGINEKNKETCHCSAKVLKEKGYVPCGICIVN